MLIDLSSEEIQLLRQLLVEDQLKPIFAARPPEACLGRAEALLDKLYVAMDYLEIGHSMTVH